MKFLIIFSAWSAWAVAVLLWCLDYFGTIQQPLWVITSPVWGLTLIIVIAYTWADYKANRNAED